MKKAKHSFLSHITFLVIFFTLMFYCTSENPLDISESLPNEFNQEKDNINGFITKNGLAKLPAAEIYISSKADLQFSFLIPDYDWEMHDLTEGRSIISLYSPKVLINSPAEDLLPRVTIVEMVFGSNEGESAGWTTKGMANYRTKMLKEKYGEENVNVLQLDESIIKDFPCTHFTYEVKYPVSRKHAVVDEYGLYYNNHYYMIQFAKLAKDSIIIETFNEILNNLKIAKSLIS